MWHYDFAPDAFSGQRLGRYQIVCQLSSGGMAEIFLGVQAGFEGFRKLVVLKRLRGHTRGDERYVKMLVAEAKATASFIHPNLAQVFDFDSDGQDPFLAMEFVAGATLGELRASHERAGPLPIGFTLGVVADTAHALHYAHTFTDPFGRQQPVIHRDVAEKNVMVTYDGVTKLLDFGIAKRPNKDPTTAVGVIKGTPGYMSPEQVRGDPVDARTDVFSLGAMLHECLTGRRLFGGQDRQRALSAPLTQTVEPPSRLRPEITGALDEVVLKALSREREARFSTARDFARALEQLPAHPAWSGEQRGRFVTERFSSRREKTRDAVTRILDPSDAAGSSPVSVVLTPPPSLPRGATVELAAPQAPEPLAAAGRRPSWRPWVAASLVIAAGVAALLSSTRSAEPEPELRVEAAPPPLAVEPVPPPEPLEPSTTEPSPTAPESEPEPPAVAAAGPQPATELKQKALRSAKPRSVPATTPSLTAPALPRAVPAPATAALRIGKLNLEASPAAHVYYGAQDLGLTPLSAVSLPAGQLPLKLVGPDGAAVRLEVNIVPGEVTRLAVQLTALPRL